MERPTAPSDADWTCAFTPLSSCTHESLFSDNYHRTNRTNRTKIVRCFPHCCPEHRTRSYCCTALMLTVTQPDDAIDSTVGLQVFARFRAVEDDGIYENELLPANAIHSSLQTPEQPTASWVTSRVFFRLRNVVVFEINPEARWLYAWASGATMAQRLTRHLLEAIVVMPCRDARALKVVAVTRSPAFTFSSFRHTVPNNEQSFLFRALSEMQQLSPREDTTDDPTATSSCDSQTTDRTEAQQVTFPAALDALISHVIQLPASRFRHLIPHWDTGTGPPSVMDTETMAVHAVWWIHTNNRVQHESALHTKRAVSSLGDPESLRRAYRQWIDHVRRSGERFLECYGWSWAPLLRGAASSESEVASRHVNGLQHFIAAVRQHAIQQERSARPGPKPDAEWKCDSTEIQARRFDGARMVPVDGIETVSVGVLLLIYTQLVRWRIGFDARSKRLFLQSTAGAWTTQRPGLDLVLDHSYRCFSTLPNGDSSLGPSLFTGYSIGDYIGFVGTAGPVPRLHVTLFAWPTDVRFSAYRWHWTLKATNERSWSLTLRVDTADLSLLHTSETPPIETLRLNEKFALVDKWATQFEALFPYDRVPP